MVWISFMELDSLLWLNYVQTIWPGPFDNCWAEIACLRGGAQANGSGSSPCFFSQSKPPRRRPGATEFVQSYISPTASTTPSKVLQSSAVHFTWEKFTRVNLLITCLRRLASNSTCCSRDGQLPTLGQAINELIIVEAHVNYPFTPSSAYPSR